MQLALPAQCAFVYQAGISVWSTIAPELWRGQAVRGSHHVPWYQDVLVWYCWGDAQVGRLQRRGRQSAGFHDIEVWTLPEPTRFAPGEEFEAYLAKVCLRAYMAEMPESARLDFLHAVAEAMGGPVID